MLLIIRKTLAPLQPPRQYVLTAETVGSVTNYAAISDSPFQYARTGFSGVAPRTAGAVCDSIPQA